VVYIPSYVFFLSLAAQGNYLNIAHIYVSVSCKKKRKEEKGLLGWSWFYMFSSATESGVNSKSQ